jgi:putative ABC transport system permease protein
MITQQLEQTTGLIMVMQKSEGGLLTSYAASRLTENQANELLSFDGIKSGTAIIMQSSYLEESQTLGQPTLFKIGVDPSNIDLYTTEAVKLDEGEKLEAGDVDYINIGSNIAEKLGLEVGDTYEIDGMDLTVKGIFKKFGDSGVDDGVIMPIETAKDVLNRDDYSTVILYPDDIEEADNIAADINDNIKDVNAFTTSQLSEQISQIIDQIGFFTIGIGAISAIVGGLGVMNTMIMSVMERRREIGVLKAIGATNGYVIRMVLVESALISLIGGFFGIGLGFMGSKVLEIATQGSARGVVTLRLAFYSLAFAVALGVIGGLYPSKRAADLSPIEALRYE